MKFLPIILILLLSFTSWNQTEKKATVLLPDREAQLEWVYLRIYDDNTFEYESRGLVRKGDVYTGIVQLKNDTLYFEYSGSVPKSGNKAILTKKSISYFDGIYTEYKKDGNQLMLQHK